MSDWQFATAKAGVFLVFLVPVILAWYRSWYRLRHNGFNKRVWRVGLWFLVVITVVQVGEILLVPVTGGLVRCPYDTLTIAVVSLLVLYGLYCFHLGAGNKGSFSKFLLLIAGPLFGEAALNSREIGTSGAKLMVRLFEAIAGAVGHLHGLVRL